jgi:ABC-type lipoprotein export system ATPase subunit
MSGFAVELEDVTRRYVPGPEVGITAIDDVMLPVDPGQVVAITGPSGSGNRRCST